MERLELASKGRVRHEQAMPRLPPPTLSAVDWLSQIEVRLTGETREVVAIAYLDAASEVIGLRVAEDGARAQVALPLRDILRDVLEHEAQSLVEQRRSRIREPMPCLHTLSMRAAPL